MKEKIFYVAVNYIKEDCSLFLAIPSIFVGSPEKATISIGFAWLNRILEVVISWK